MATSEVPGERRWGRRPGVALWVLAGLAASALLVGAVVGALRGPADLDPDSPEGVVQAYLQAVLEEDYAEATGYFAAETADRCGSEAFADEWLDDWQTADLEGVGMRGEEAQVTVRFRSPSAPPSVPAHSGYGMSQTFTLVEEGGAWRLTETPWPLSHCPVVDR